MTEAISVARRPEEREKDSGRERERDEKEGEETSRERSERGERKTFLLPPLLATEAILVEET